MLELHLLNGSTPGRSRVVNEDVDFLKPGKRFLHNGTDLVRVSDVTSKPERLNPESPQLLRCLFATLPLPRAKYQVRAHLCQALGHLAPEANRASRNNSHSSCKVKELLGIHGQSWHPRITPPFSAQNKQQSSIAAPTAGRALFRQAIKWPEIRAGLEVHKGRLDGDECAGRVGKDVQQGAE